MESDKYAAAAQARYLENKSTKLLKNRTKLFTRAYRPLLPRIRKARTILDYGCGGGEFLSFLSTLTTASLQGFDTSESQIKRAKELLGDSPRVTLTSRPEDLGNKYDLVFSMHVIEHVPDNSMEKYLKTLTSITAEEGALVLATPNGMNAFASAMHMSFDSTHIRMHSPFSIAELLCPFGFHIIEVHREMPQAYDFMTGLKMAGWLLTAGIAKLGAFSCVAGARGLKYPLTMSSSFFVVATRQKL